jgi:hypothetical protein
MNPYQISFFENHWLSMLIGLHTILLILLLNMTSKLLMQLLNSLGSFIIIATKLNKPLQLIWMGMRFCFEIEFLHHSCRYHIFTTSPINDNITHLATGGAFGVKNVVLKPFFLYIG